MRACAILALPALLCCSLVSAVPSPADHDQRPLQALTPPPPPPSRWRTFSGTIIETLWGTKNAHSKSPCHKDKSATPLVPSHALAQYGEDLVLRFNISNREEAASLAEAADTLLLDVWEFSHNWVDIRLSKNIIPSLLGLLPRSLQASHVPLLRERELAQLIHDTYPTPREAQQYDHKKATAPPTHFPERRPFSPNLVSPNAAEENLFFSDYQPLSVIQPWMRLLASLFTTHVRLINIGISYEGRNIPALRVGVHPTNNEDPSPPRKTVLIVGSLHAREWISTSTVNYLAYAMITGYGKTPAVTKLLEAFDFVFVPTLNPDGYVYTWETDRLWRKNRQRTNIKFCHGVDLDRAFDFQWETQGNPCSESFAGEKPFEAVEARRLADWAKNETDHNNVQFVGFLDLHSYSQQILYPYSYSCTIPPPGLENLEELAYGLGKAIRMTHNHYYEVMPACEGNVITSRANQRQTLPHIEASGGSALDFFYHTLNTRYAYQIKLRDLGAYGFLLPKANIIPTGHEILSAVMYFGEFLADEYGESGVAEPALRKADVVDEVEAETVRHGREVEEDWVVVEDLAMEEDDGRHWDMRRRKR